jgi:hypothetical protein
LHDEVAIWAPTLGDDSFEFDDDRTPSARHLGARAREALQTRPASSIVGDVGVAVERVHDAALDEVDV